MTNGLTSPKATDRPPGPTPQAARGAPPPNDAFAGMLDAHQARTAIAEGQNDSPRQDAPASVERKPSDEQPQKDSSTDKDDPGATTTIATTDTSTVAAVLAAALPTPLDAIPTPPVAAEPAQAATQMVVAGGAPTPVVQVVTPAQAEVPVVAPVASQPAVTAPAAAAPAAAAAVAAEATPADAQQTQPSASPTPGAATQPQASQPVAAPASGQPAAGGSPDQGQPQQPDAKPAQTLQQARAAVAYARPQAEPQQAQAAQPATQPAPVAPATSTAPAAIPATPVSAATPVPLARSAEAVEHVLRLASSRGVTHARIALNPADLGSVDVHIRSTAEGLVARVVAHSAEAVQTLQHAAGDLRRSLEEQGLNVMSLDIGQSGESGTGRAGSDAGKLASGGRDGSSPDGSDADETTQTTTLRLPTGVLVDVLA